MAQWFVYIVQASSGQLYTGIATDVARRVEEHNHSPRGAKWCRAHRPLELVWQRELGERAAAARLEARIKKLTRSGKLELVRGDESVLKGEP